MSILCSLVVLNWCLIVVALRGLFISICQEIIGEVHQVAPDQLDMEGA